MKTTLLLAALAFSALAPTASAVDLCWKYGICTPDPTDFVSECAVDGIAVRVDHCEPQLWTCDLTYMGGGGQWPWQNFQRECVAYLA